MEDYKTLLRLRINHEYFEGMTNGIMDIRILPESLVLLRNRQLILKQEMQNQWALLGNMESAGVDEESDVLWMEFILKDTTFLYYTEWKKYNSGVSYVLDFSDYNGKIKVVDKVQTMTEKKMGTFFTGKLKLSMEMYQRAQKGKPDEVSLDFQAKEMFWEYLFIQRKTGSEPCQLSLEEQNGELLFTEPELFPVDFTDKAVYKCVSRTPVKMKERYHFRLDLSEVVRKEPELKRKIVKNIEYPIPGQFHDLKGNYLRKIVYF